MTLQSYLSCLPRHTILMERLAGSYKPKGILAPCDSKHLATGVLTLKDSWSYFNTQLRSDVLVRRS